MNPKLLILIVFCAFFSAVSSAEDGPSERAALGVNIATRDAGGGPVEGVAVVGVTPGGAADRAGLRADDMLIAIDDLSLTADSLEAANERLVGFMRAVKPGQELSVTYLRGSQALETTLVADAFDPLAVPPGYPFREDLERLGRRFEDEFIAPLQMRWRHYGLFAGMELVALTPELGRYFGTDEGLLVVRAPTAVALGLKDGDVIRRIGARTPNDPAHAMRILRSYEPGEVLVIAILRDRREEELSVILPEPAEKTGWRLDRWLPLPAREPAGLT